MPRYGYRACQSGSAPLDHTTEYRPAICRGNAIGNTNLWRFFMPCRGHPKLFENGWEIPCFFVCGRRKRGRPYISTIPGGLRTKQRSLQSRPSRKSGKCGRKSKKPKRKRAAPTTGSIQGSTGRETLKSSGNMTVSRRGNTGQGERRRLPHSPHSKTE